MSEYQEVDEIFEKMNKSLYLDCGSSYIKSTDVIKKVKIRQPIN